MKSIHVILFSLFLSLPILNGQDLTIHGEYKGLFGFNTTKETGIFGLGTLNFENGNLKYRLNNIYMDIAHNGEIPYKISQKDGICFLNIGLNAFLLIKKENDFLLVENKSLFYFSQTTIKENFLSSGYDYFASSQLKERGGVFKAENLGYPLGGNWASANGYGIGDKLNFSFKKNVNSITIGNGYLDYNNPSLFFLNSRVKKIKITEINSMRTGIFELKDQIHLQSVDIKNLLGDLNGKEKKIQIEILEVFPGKKFKDVCLYYLGVE